MFVSYIKQDFLMKKIMFNDRYQLTELVMIGKKTMTRRTISKKTPTDSIENALPFSLYNVGDIVAIAQSYEKAPPQFQMLKEHLKKSPGWKNKMFVSPKLMPHHIKITSIKLERLNDINEEDCISEGITLTSSGKYGYYDEKKEIFVEFDGPREAFVSLIDNVSGKGTWDSNPYVFCYTFNLID